MIEKLVGGLVRCIKVHTVISVIVVLLSVIAGLFLVIQIPKYMQAKCVIENATGGQSPTWVLIETVRKDLALMDKIGSSSNVECMRINEDGSITYIIPINDTLKDEIKIYNDADGNIIEEIWEGDIYNKMILTPEGELFLDGKKVG